MKKNIKNTVTARVGRRGFLARTWQRATSSRRSKLISSVCAGLLLLAVGGLGGYVWFSVANSADAATVDDMTVLVDPMKDAVVTGSHVETQCYSLTLPAKLHIDKDQSDACSVVLTDGNEATYNDISVDWVDTSETIDQFLESTKKTIMGNGGTFIAANKSVLSNDQEAISINYTNKEGLQRELTYIPDSQASFRIDDETLITGYVIDGYPEDEVSTDNISTVTDSIVIN